MTPDCHQHILIYSELWSTCINMMVNHWGRVTHICVSKLTIIGSDNGLPPDRRQAIIWTNAGILLIGPLGTNLSEILIEIHAFSFKKMHLKTSSGKWPPFCLGLNVLNLYHSLLGLVLWSLHYRSGGYFDTGHAPKLMLNSNLTKSQLFIFHISQLSNWFQILHRAQQ